MSDETAERSIYPEGPVWILGIPYAFELTDLPDPNDEDYNWRMYRDQSLFKVADHFCDERLRETVFSCIVSNIYDLMGRGSQDTDRNLYEAFAQFGRTLYGTLRSNPGTLAFIAGWNDERPEALSICGFHWTVGWVDHVKGSCKNTYGVTRWQQQEIDVRRDMAPEHTRCVVLHELCHATGFYVAHAYRSDEQFIRAVSYLLMDVFRANPDYMKALFGYEEGVK